MINNIFLTRTSTCLTARTLYAYPAPKMASTLCLTDLINALNHHPSLSSFPLDGFDAFIRFAGRIKTEIQWQLNQPDTAPASLPVYIHVFLQGVVQPYLQEGASQQSIEATVTKLWDSLRDIIWQRPTPSLASFTAQELEDFEALGSRGSNASLYICEYVSNVLRIYKDLH